MRPIGGELELKSLEENIYFTDSGRSSLRLFIRSGNQNKKFIIPNYFCEIIENVLIEENVSYAFYNILDDLSIDFNSLNDKEFDVVYIINYFGEIQKIKNINLDGKIIVEDNVFLYRFENHNKYKNWFGFNSFRKTSHLADGSLIKTTLDINQSLINNNEAKYSSLKYEAKNVKFNFLIGFENDEEKYLSMFAEGEDILNHQTEIFNISRRTMFELTQYDFLFSNEVSKKYYELLSNEFSQLCVNKEPKEYSFFVIRTSNRDELRVFLMSKNIYLPIHWPKSTQKSELYNELISIPLFSLYKTEDISHIVTSIKEYYEKHK